MDAGMDRGRTDTNTGEHESLRSRLARGALAAAVLVALLASFLAIRSSRENDALRDQLQRAAQQQSSQESLEARHAVELGALRQDIDAARARVAQRSAELDVVSSQLHIALAAMDSVLESLAEDEFEPLPEVLQQRHALLNAAASGYDQLLASSGGDQQIFLVAVRCQRALAETCQQLELHDAAGAAYAKCLRLLAQALEERVGDAEFDLQVAMMRYHLAQSLRAAERPDEADSLLQLALNGFVKLSEEHPEAAEYRYHQARIHHELSRQAEARGDRDEASSELLIALAIQQEVVAAEPENERFRHFLAQCHTGVASTSPQDETSQSHLRTAIAELKSLLEAEPKLEYRRDLAVAYRELAATLTGSDADHTQRIELYEQALSHLQQLLQEAPARSELESLLAETHQNLAAAFSAIGQEDKASAHWRQALGLRTALSLRFPNRGPCHRDLAAVHFGWGRQLERRGRLDAAADHYRAAWEAIRRVDLQGVTRESARYATALSGALRKLQDQPAAPQALPPQPEIRPASATSDD